MAEEALVTWENLMYGTRFAMYTADGDTQESNAYQGRKITTLVPGQEEGVYFTDMTHVNIDFASGTSENKNHYVLSQFSNGVKIECDAWMEGGQPGSEIYYSNKDGAKITALTVGSLPLLQTGGIDLSNVSYYFNPFTQYFAMTEATEFPYMDSMSYYTMYQEMPQPDFPDVEGFMEKSDADRFFYPTGEGSTYGRLTNDEDLQEFLEIIKNAGDGTPLIPMDPEDDTSTTGGGGGDYNPFSDPIGHPTLPIGGDAISTGFVRVYQPNTSQLHALASKLWSDDFINTIKKIQNDPMEAIISLHSIPFSMPTVSGNCVVGNYDSHVAMPVILSQFVSKSLGSIRIPEHWGSALDYSPYVVVDCFIPFVGVRSLQVDDAIGKSLNINANVDILTGATIVTVMCGNSVLYAWNTNVIVKHPITMSSMGPLYQSILGMAGNVINGAVSGGIGGAVGGGLGSAVNVAMSKHSQISRGGAIAGNAGALGHFTPYLILHRPKQSLASGFAHFKGYPSNITASIGSVTGYSEIESVHLTGIPCTDAERDEIQTLLYNGVIL